MFPQRSAAIALVAFAFLAGPNVSAGQAPCAQAVAGPATVQVAVEVRLGHYASGLVLALESCGRLLIPVLSTLSLAGIRVSEQAGSVRGHAPNSGRLIVVDARRKSVR